jgi:hypothetical protein
MLSIGAVRQRHEAAFAALARINALATELRDPYVTGGVNPRKFGGGRAPPIDLGGTSVAGW